MSQTDKLVQLNHLTSQLNRVQRELMQVQEFADGVHMPSEDHASASDDPRMTLTETLSQLSTALEELQVAEEEIHHQNEELQAVLASVKQERMRYQELFDFAPEPYLLTDINGVIQEANHATTDLLKVPAHLLAGKPLAVFVTPESKQAFYRLMVTARDTHTRKVDEFMLKPRHSAPIPAEFTVLTTRDAKGLPSGQRWLIRDVSRRKEIEGELEQSRQQLQTFASNIQTAREDERARVAREIHDELGQTLTGLRLDIGMAKKQVPEEMTALHSKLEDISDTVVSTIQTVRRIMTDLRPSVLDEAGLIAAVEWQCRDFKARTGIHCRFLTKESELDLSDESTNAIFRLTQEMLTNAARHSGATRVTVELKQASQWVQLEVRDNGRGITDGEINNPVTAGLLGMRERVRLLNGEITFQGTQGRGTRIRVRLPRHSTQCDPKEAESNDAGA
jgi:PAS domain S-box-containing protein